MHAANESIFCTVTPPGPLLAPPLVEPPPPHAAASRATPASTAVSTHARRARGRGRPGSAPTPVLDVIWLPSLRSGRAAGTILGGGDQAAARVACEFGVNMRRPPASSPAGRHRFPAGLRGGLELGGVGIDAGGEEADADPAVHHLGSGQSGYPRDRM